MSWASEEMAAITLGDRRLDRRAVTILENMSEAPDSSIPAISEGHTERTATYRFLSNEQVTPAALLAPHRDRTITRMASEPVVLCVEDTTQLDFTTHRATEGLGPLYKEFQRGMFLHAMLAVTPGGVGLGVLNADFYVRDPDRPELTSGQKAARPIEEKESYRWVRGYQQMNKLAQGLTTQCIYMGDRESDFEELLDAAQGQRGHVLLRARHDRLLEDGERMWNTVWESPALGEQTFEMGARPGRTARIVRQTLRGMKITLPETATRDHEISFNVVIAQEVSPPEGEEPVSWTLLTTLPVRTAAEVTLIVEYYRSRWTIEEYFKVLKSGCAVEKLQLETAQRLQVAITLYMIVAYRVLLLVKLGRETPDVSCEAVLDQEEWKIAYQIDTKKKPPKKPPRLGDIVTMIAKLGGYTARKSDGPPGQKTVWIGLSVIRHYLFVLQKLKGIGG